MKKPRERSNQTIYTMAMWLYHRYGQSKVYDLANRLRWKKWRHCTPCEDTVPIINLDGTNTCLVCGSTYHGK